MTTDVERAEALGLLVVPGGAGPCFVCSAPSPYVEMNFEAPFCSELHVHCAWNAYELTSFGRQADHHGFWP